MAKARIVESFGGGGTPQLNRSQEARRSRSQSISVILNLFQDLLTGGKDAKRHRCKAIIKILGYYGTRAPRIILKLSGNLNVSDGTATFHSSLKKTYRPNVLTSYRLKKCAFTLAEVLVTLGIIGVVSAMTVPTLIQNHQRKVYVTQLHKVYNTLSQGLLNFQNDRNAVNLKEAGLVSFGFTNFFKTYFNVVQDCGEDAVPCFAEAYKKISGNNTDFTCQGDCVALADGTAIGVTNSTGLSDRIQFVVDINGAVGPNIFGRDAFSLFLYTNNGVIDDLSYINDAGEELDSAVTVAPLSEEQREKGFEEACIAANARFHGCFGKLLNDNWEMTY